jgi:hypothetical protein
MPLATESRDMQTLKCPPTGWRARLLSPGSGAWTFDERGVERMRCLHYVVGTAFLAVVFSGCSEDQPNAPAQPSEVNKDFVSKTTDMMKAANSGMDPKMLKKGQSQSAPKK